MASSRSQQSLRKDEFVWNGEETSRAVLRTPSGSGKAMLTLYHIHEGQRLTTP